MSSNIYVDCTELLLMDRGTGIQRVEYNILSNRQDVAKRLNVNITPVIYIDDIGYVPVENLNLGDAISKVGYLNIVKNQIKYIKHFRFFCKLVFNNRKISYNLDKLWNTKFHRLFSPILFIITIPIIIASLVVPSFPNKKKGKSIRSGDIFVVLGSWWGSYMPNMAGIKKNNVGTVVMIYDLIPTTHPQYFNKSLVASFCSRVDMVLQKADLIVTISNYTKMEIEKYAERKNLLLSRDVEVAYLGYQLDNRKQGLEVRKNIISTLDDSRSTLIAVGTLEPRKNHAYLLDVMEAVWDSGFDALLIIIGKYGWQTEDIKDRIITHEYYGSRILWYKDLNDVELEYMYKHATAMVNPSIVEGFGLPIVEALSNKCPVIASDIPVFREIGGSYCNYIPLNNAAKASEDVISVIENGESFKRLIDFKWPTWEECSYEFFSIIKNSLVESK